MQSHHTSTWEKPWRISRTMRVTQTKHTQFTSFIWTPSHFPLLKQQIFTHFSSCIYFSPTGSCHPSSRLNCNSHNIAHTFNPFQTLSILLQAPFGQEKQTYDHPLQFALGLKAIILTYRLLKSQGCCGWAAQSITTRTPGFTHQKLCTGSFILQRQLLCRPPGSCFCH